MPLLTTILLSMSGASLRSMHLMSEEEIPILMFFRSIKPKISPQRKTSTFVCIQSVLKFAYANLALLFFAQ